MLHEANASGGYDILNVLYFQSHSFNNRLDGIWLYEIVSAPGENIVVVKIQIDLAKNLCIAGM